MTPGSDVAALVDYWGRGGRAKDVRPLIEGLANIPSGGTHFGRIHPAPFARDRLAPFRSGRKRRRHEARLPLERAEFLLPGARRPLLNPAEVYRTLTQDYYRIYSNPLLGDVVEFVHDEGNARHAAVYVADDFVFTERRFLVPPLDADAAGRAEDLLPGAAAAASPVLPAQNL